MDMSNHPTPAAQADNPRERIVAALRQRAEATPASEAPASPPETPACAGDRPPNLPTLIAALPGDNTRAPQTEFTRGRQVLFIENLSTTGSARSASAAAGVSHQSAYRARRSVPAFRLAWDAALVAARRCAEDALACRAIDGVEEEVLYHGEVVATRRRYSDRLLLAHLARLDGLREDPRAAAFAEDWDGAMARFASGEEPVPGEGGNFSSGPCNTWSMSNRDCAADEADEADWADEAEDEDEAGDDGIDWEDEDAANAELDRIHAAMEADRPADAPRLDADDPHGVIADAQFQAFEQGVPRWWLVVPPVPYGEGEAWSHAEAEPLEDTNDSCSPALRLAGEPAAQDKLPGGQAGASGEGSPTSQACTEPREVPAAVYPEPGRGAGTRGTEAEPEPEAEPEQAPEAEPEGEPHQEVLYRSWRPVNDGRLQPY